MRRVGNLWSDVTTFENLHRAAYAVLRGKRSHREMADFFGNLEPNLPALQGELEEGFFPGVAGGGFT